MCWDETLVQDCILSYSDQQIDGITAKTEELVFRKSQMDPFLNLLINEIIARFLTLESPGGGGVCTKNTMLRIQTDCIALASKNNVISIYELW